MIFENNPGWQNLLDIIMNTLQLLFHPWTADTSCKLRELLFMYYCSIAQ